MPVQQRLFVIRRQIPVIGDALVKVVGDKVENILLEIGAGANDAVDLVATDHLRQREAEFGRAHGAGKRDQHAPPAIQVRAIRIRRILEGGCIEMAEVLVNELGYRAGRGLVGSIHAGENR